ncbi:type I secretion system permease/ATPase [Pseudomonadota bacterium]
MAQETSAPKQTPEQLAEIIKTCRSGMKAVIVFSLFINLMMLAAPLYMLQVFDRVIGSGSTDTLLYLTIITIAAIATLACLEMVRGRVMVKLGTWLERRLSNSVFASSVMLASRNQDQPSVQGLRDVSILRNFLTGPSLFPILDAPWMPIFLAIIFLLHPTLGWIATGGAVVLFALAVVNDVISRKSLQQSAAVSIDGLKQAESAVRNADAIMAMGLMDNLHNRWSKRNGEALALLADANARSGMLSALSKFTRLGLQVIMMGVGAWLVLGAELTPGGMVAGSILLGRALAPVDQAIGAWKGAIAARGAFDRIKILMTLQPEPEEKLDLPPPEGKLSVEKLVYAYSHEFEPVLRGLSLEIQPGEVLGIIGPTASGKSTLAHLLVGNAVPESGHVRIDGADMHNWNRRDRGNYLGYLPQDVELFEGTVSENIARMGTFEAEDIIKAAQAANVHEIILSLPKGYETNIGEGGAVLSGGQRQRIALARALYGNPRLVVLDEPNSSLDFTGDSALVQSLRNLKIEKVTTVIITHRPSILKNADKILVLYPGGKYEFGDCDIMLRKVVGPNQDSITQINREKNHARA